VSEKARDPMLELVGALPDQLAHSRGILDGLDLPVTLARRRVLLSGMGGSAAAASLAAGILDGQSTQLVVNRRYRLPMWVDEDCLLIFSSYSGNTEEVLACWEEAEERLPRAPRLIISSGGALSAAAELKGVPWVPLPGGLPPRASLGYGVGALFGLLGRLGLFHAAEEGLAEAEELLRIGNERLGPQRNSGENPAHRLSKRLYGKLPLIYSGEGMPAAVAQRWRAQINENGKALAYCNVLPELDHNEIIGWEVPTRVRAETCVVALRDRGDHVRVQRRFELTRSILGARVPGWEVVESQGNSPIARAMSLVQFGDYVSVYLAEAGGVPATPVAAIEELKEKLAKPQA